ncbi:MAG: C40 family peptidase [Candidatus Zixiibacteriota bacterium]
MEQARPTRPSQTRRRRGVLYHAAVTGALAALSLSCSPYPIYNTSPSRGDQPAAASTDDATNTDADDMPAVADSRAVDPRVFARVAERYVGSPYKRGGSDRYGIDCSNLVSVVYREYSGTRVPSSTRGLYHLPRIVTPENLAVGDLVFFDLGSRAPSHVGLYMGERRFLHASETEGVIITSLDAPPYRDAYVGARRVLSALRSQEQ